MTSREPTDDAGGSGPNTDALVDRTPATSRRSFLKGAAGAGAVAAGLGVGSIGTAGAAIIPTPYLTRDGNVMRDPQGNRVVPRGMNMIDPKRLQTKEFRPTIDETLERMVNRDEGWYTNVVRIPVQPLDIGGHDAGGIPPVPAFDEGQLQSYIENYLTPTVEKCAELGVYCIVDYHRHKEQGDEHLYTSDEMDQELRLFWNTVAPLYESYSNVVYEVYNEPIGPYPGHGDPNTSVDVTAQRAKEEGWDVWKEAAQPWVDVIREHAPRNPIIIGSPQWSQYTYWAPENEFDGDNLGYVGHVYAQQGIRPLSEYFGTPAEEVPVWMTEFGWADGNRGEYVSGSADDEGEEFRTFFRENDHVPWTVWCFDNKWRPAMLNHGDFSLNDYGQYWKEFLAEQGTEDLPAGDGSTPDPVTTTTTDPGTTTTDPGTTTTEPGTTTTAGDTPGMVGQNTAYPGDPDSDGLYEDVNGNDRQDIADAVDLFQHREDVDADYFDFTGDGSMNIGDAVSLFQENSG